MAYSKVLKNLVAVLRLDKEAMARVARDPSATIWGFVILLGPPVINLILSSFAFPSGFGVMLSRFMLWPMFVPAFSIIGVIFLMSNLAVRLFHGKGDVIGFFRTVSFSAIIFKPSSIKPTS